MSNPPASLKEGNSEVLVNFRSLSGFKNRVYRCGRPDDLATILNAESYTWEERIFLFDLTLNVDLRSNPEVDHAKQGAWSSKAPGGAFDIVQLDDVAGKDGQDLSSLFEKKEDDSKHRRVLLRANLLDKTSKYINEHWFENNIGVSKDEDFPTYMKIVFAEVKKRGLDLFMYTSRDAKGGIL